MIKLRKVKFIILFAIIIYIMEIVAIGSIFSYLYGYQRFLAAMKSVTLWQNLSYLNVVAIISFFITNYIYPLKLNKKEVQK